MPNKIRICPPPQGLSEDDLEAWFAERSHLKGYAHPEPTTPSTDVCELCGGAEILPNLFSHEPTCPLYEIPEEEDDDDIIQE